MLFYPIRIFFTFHNVSINTHFWPVERLLFLHFTFHNVSINTIYTSLLLTILRHSLHSTMFLLIPDDPIRGMSLYYSFTFHNVSINTMRRIPKHWHIIHFTFHNVSINTWDAAMAGFVRYVLYIPQCFY